MRLIFLFLTCISSGFHLSRSFYPKPKSFLYQTHRHIKPKSANVVRLEKFIARILRLTFTLHGIAMKMQKKTCSFIHLRNFWKLKDNRKKNRRRIKKQNIIKCYADKNGCSAYVRHIWFNNNFMFDKSVQIQFQFASSI